MSSSLIYYFFLFTPLYPFQARRPLLNHFCLQWICRLSGTSMHACRNCACQLRRHVWCPTSARRHARARVWRKLHSSASRSTWTTCTARACCSTRPMKKARPSCRNPAMWIITGVSIELRRFLGLLFPFKTRKKRAVKLLSSLGHFSQAKVWERITAILRSFYLFFFPTEAWWIPKTWPKVFRRDERDRLHKKRFLVCLRHF